MPDFDLHDLPIELGQWRGEKVKLDPQIFQVLGADTAIDRVYRDTQNHPVFLHSAVFGGCGLSPHPPTVCYPAAGWELLDEHTTAINVGGDKSVVAGSLTFQRDTTILHVLVWYQLGDQTFGTWTGGKAVRRHFWGQSIWPATVKVMLQDENADACSAEARMIDLAKEVYRWMNDAGSRVDGAGSQTQRDTRYEPSNAH